MVKCFGQASSKPSHFTIAELYRQELLSLLISLLRNVHVLALDSGEPTKEGQGQCQIILCSIMKKAGVGEL